VRTQVSENTDTTTNLPKMDANSLKAHAKVHIQMEVNGYETKEECEEDYDYNAERIINSVITDIALDIALNITTVDRVNIIWELPFHDVEGLSNLGLIVYYLNETINETTMEEAVNAHFTEREQELERIAGVVYQNSEYGGG